MSFGFAGDEFGEKKKKKKEKGKGKGNRNLVRKRMESYDRRRKVEGDAVRRVRDNRLRVPFWSGKKKGKKEKKRGRKRSRTPENRGRRDRKGKKFVDGSGELRRRRKKKAKKFVLVKTMLLDNQEDDKEEIERIQMEKYVKNLESALSDYRRQLRDMTQCAVNLERKKETLISRLEKCRRRHSIDSRNLKKYKKELAASRNNSQRVLETTKRVVDLESVNAFLKKKAAELVSLVKKYQMQHLKDVEQIKALSAVEKVNEVAEMEKKLVGFEKKIFDLENENCRLQTKQREMEKIMKKSENAD